MLTAKSQLEDKLDGLNNGTNDYITKPFHIDELIARVNVQLRNTKDSISKNYKVQIKAIRGLGYKLEDNNLK